VAVLTQVDNGRKDLNQSAVAALQEMGLPVASVSLTMSGKYHDALFHGQGVQEFDPKGKQAEEISNLYTFIMKKARAAKRKRAA